MEPSRIFDYKPIRENQTEQMEAEIELLLQSQDHQSTILDSDVGCEKEIPANYREASAIAEGLHQEYSRTKWESAVGIIERYGRSFFATLRRTLFGWVGKAR